eukprot:scaffold181532_cov22-Tisochrysis_lutea.AAC.1
MHPANLISWSPYCVFSGQFGAAGQTVCALVHLRAGTRRGRCACEPRAPAAAGEAAAVQVPAVCTAAAAARGPAGGGVDAGAAGGCEHKVEGS